MLKLSSSTPGRCGGERYLNSALDGATAALSPGKEHQSLPIILEDGWAPTPVCTI